MENLRIKHGQRISIVADEYARPYDTIIEAMELSKKLSVPIDLDINGFTISLPNDSSARELDREYKEWAGLTGEPERERSTTEAMVEYMEKKYLEEGRKYKETSSFYEQAVIRRESKMNDREWQEKKASNPIRLKKEFDNRDKSRLSAFNTKTELVAI